MNSDVWQVASEMSSPDLFLLDICAVVAKKQASPAVA